jgi:outer membrane protein OmpA-like peptidoglycan-associated protein
MVNRKRSDKTRLTAKGYGESQLINKCANVNCTAEEHQVNRRSEFIIIELKNNQDIN